MKKAVFPFCFFCVFCMFFSFSLQAQENKLNDGKKAENKITDKENKASETAEKGPGLELPTLIVFDIKAEKGVESGSASLLTEIVLDEVAGIFKGKYKVIGQKDIDKMLFWETNKSLKNCTESSCLMQIAGAMGAEYYIEGSVGIMGEKYVLALKYIDAMKVEILSRKTVVIEKDENRLIENVKAVINEILLGKVTKEDGNKSAPVSKQNESLKDESRMLTKETVRPGEKKAEESKTIKKMIAYSLIGAGLLSGGFGVKFHLDANDIKNNYNMTPEEAARANQDYKDLTTGAAVAYSLGGACIIGGIVLLLLSHEKENKSEK